MGKRETKETDERIKIAAESIKNTITEKVENGEWHNSLSKKRQVKYKEILLDSSWEAIFAKFLDDNNIKWCRPKIGIDYIFEGKTHKYFPDFYIPLINKYVEIKGFEREKDIAKYKSISNLILIKEKEIKSILKGTFDIKNLFSDQN